MVDTEQEPGLYAMIPAGGAGTRLWPLSRADVPKFLLDLTGSGRSLLQQTVDRLVPLVGDRVLVVTGAAHADAVRRQLPRLETDHVVAEPSRRDSMAAIGLAAAMLERTDPEAVIGSFAADHAIADPEAFRACVREAAAVARTGLIVTIGIEPTRASTGFGYVHEGDPIEGFPTARRVRAFEEKPSPERAEELVRSGECRWNAGMFVARVGVLLDQLAREHPALAAGVRTIAAEPDRLEEVWEGLTRIAIDHAVAEPAAAAGLVATVPGSFGWDDVGDFASLAPLLPAAEAGRPRVLGDRDLVRAVESTGLVVPHDRVIAVVGLEDVAVVDTGDALLVTTYAEAQRVREVVEALEAEGRDDLT